MIDPPVWSREQLEAASEEAEERFRETRHTEPLEVYLEQFDEYQGIVEEVIEQTVDLTRLEDHALELMTDERRLEVLRYLTGPPISKDDLKVLMRARSLSAKALTDNPELITEVVAFMRDWHDRRRFPWLVGGWEPEEYERKAAVLATTVLIAMRRTETLRRNQEKKIQEDLVEQQFRRARYEKVETRMIKTLSDAPAEGKFCRETTLGNRKADFVIGLWDGRTMGLECKVSNSSTNSVKRLNNDAAVKAEEWREKFGTAGIVCAAVLSGVYKVRNLENAQARGLTLFWAHDLRSLVRWIDSTKAGGLGLLTR